ncbi:hypothetical protein ACE193_16730 [Bernardetia sp. OM2101]|uniref:hypothetical protein n=1 Tax=Bernardetia sp. OM2101 TaxID=3344876 RepID=UPI0035CFEADC
MFHYHFLDEDQHSEFLSQNRIDPITGDKIYEGDCVVICAACKSAFLEESWNYLRQQHCDQYGTLNKIPKTEKIYFNGEPLVFLPFDVKNEGSFFSELIYKVFQFSTNAFLSIVPLVAIILIWYFIPSIESEGYKVLFNMILMPIGSVIFYISVVKSSSNQTTFFGQIMKNKNRFLIKNLRQNYSKGNYFAINLKNKSIVSKTALGEKEVCFSNIEKIVYIYNADRIFDKNGLLLLQICVISKKETTNYESIFKESERHKLDTFLNKLSKNLKVFQRNNTQNYY